MKLRMDKHRHDEGFTMVEMLLVLMRGCFLLMLFPLMHARHHDFMLHMEQLKQLLLLEQERAIQEVRSIKVDWNQTKMRSGENTYELGMVCEGSVIFHPNGNVDRAKTITCHQDGQSAKLIIQLGSGRMYVAK